MEEGWVTAVLWLLFGGTHVVLTMAPIRARLVRGLGETGFVVLYSVVAIVTFAGLVHYVADHREGEPRGTLLSTIPPVQGALLALSIAGFSFFVTAVLVYPRLPMAAFRHRAKVPRGVQQITRHPFFSGIAIWAGAHALLATNPVTFVFFVGFVVLGVIGGLHQDRRLVAEMGESYRAYVASTSFWPFVAIATKRQKLAWRAQPWAAYAIGVAASLGLREVHEHIFDYGGAYIIGVTSFGSIVALVGSAVRARKDTHPRPM